MGNHNVLSPWYSRLERKPDVDELTPFDPHDFVVLDDNVPVNFVMFEKYGRTDIKYSASMLEVRVTNNAHAVLIYPHVCLCSRQWIKVFLL